MVQHTAKYCRPFAATLNWHTDKFTLHTGHSYERQRDGFGRVGQTEIEVHNTDTNSVCVVLMYKVFKAQKY